MRHLEVSLQKLWWKCAGALTGRRASPVNWEALARLGNNSSKSSRHGRWVGLGWGCRGDAGGPCDALVCNLAPCAGGEMQAGDILRVWPHAQLCCLDVIVCCDCHAGWNAEPTTSNSEPWQKDCYLHGCAASETNAASGIAQLCSYEWLPLSAGQSAA